MSWSQLKSVLMISSLISIYGVSVLVVWLLGPSVDLSIILQITLTTLILLTLPIGLLIHYYRKKRANHAERSSAKEKRNAGERARQLPAPTGTYEDLSRGAEEVVQWLRATKLNGVRSNDAVFALPWFMVTGPSASGKTSLLLSSGLDFHALPSQRAADQNLVRATRGCVWSVTDAAIFLDTAGSYQSDGRDRDEWAALLETLKQQRKARPLDGFVIAVNAVAVLGMSDAQIEQQAKVLRARLDEAVQRTQTRFPVYLVFTHVDAVEGFADFFRAFTPEERAQVWGATVPLARQHDAHALFDAEFDQLYGRLLRRRTVQLGTLAAPSEQLRIFKFPGRFRRARGRLGLFATALFRPNPFSDAPLLRGFYFTSGGRAKAGGRATAGEDYFARNFFRGVLLRDKDLVAASREERRRPHLRFAAASVCAAALLVALLCGMLVSFSKNRRLISEARARGQELTRVRQAAGRSAGRKGTDAAELEAVERVREVLDELDAYERASPPPSLRFGLYAGGALNAQDS